MDESTEHTSRVDENKVIQTIILGSDWQQVLATLVAEEGMEPEFVDIIKLTDAFTQYLERLHKFDFRIPARFVLIAAILLRMKCELILEEEEKKQEKELKHIPPLNIDEIPTLPLPITRKPTRKVTLTELVGALNKAFAFEERKEGKKIRMRHAVETLIGEEENIEDQIDRIYQKIFLKKKTTFSELVPVWTRHDIVEIFIPLLHLIARDKVQCNQEEMFKEIYIHITGEEHGVLP